jgi:hypothetical protein
MAERRRAQGEREDRAFRRSVHHVASTPSTADELAKLADLRDRGTLSQPEYEQAKAKVLGTERSSVDAHTDRLRVPTR